MAARFLDHPFERESEIAVIEITQGRVFGARCIFVIMQYGFLQAFTHHIQKAPLDRIKVGGFFKAQQLHEWMQAHQ